MDIFSDIKQDQSDRWRDWKLDWKEILNDYFWAFSSLNLGMMSHISNLNLVPLSQSSEN